MVFDHLRKTIADILDPDAPTESVDNMFTRLATLTDPLDVLNTLQFYLDTAYVVALSKKYDDPEVGRAFFDTLGKYADVPAELLHELYTEAVSSSHMLAVERGYQNIPERIDLRKWGEYERQYDRPPGTMGPMIHDS